MSARSLEFSAAATAREQDLLRGGSGEPDAIPLSKALGDLADVPDPDQGW